MARAKTVYDQMIADGLDSGRLRVGVARESQASMGYVPLEFTLTVFEDITKTPEASPVAAEAKK
jgi:hypothetical protein